MTTNGLLFAGGGDKNILKLDGDGCPTLLIYQELIACCLNGRIVWQVIHISMKLLERRERGKEEMKGERGRISYNIYPRK